MVEYAIGLILLALAVTLAVRFFGETVKQKYDCAGARLDDMSGTFLKAGCTANTPTPPPTSTPTPRPTPTPPPTATPTPRPTPTPPPPTPIPPSATPRPTPRQVLTNPQDCGYWQCSGSCFHACTLTAGSPGEAITWRKMPDDTCRFFNLTTTSGATTTYQGVVPTAPRGSSCRIHYQACDAYGRCVDYYSGVVWR